VRAQCTLVRLHVASRVIARAHSSQPISNRCRIDGLTCPSSIRNPAGYHAPRGVSPSIGLSRPPDITSTTRASIAPFDVARKPTSRFPKAAYAHAGQQCSPLIGPRSPGGSGWCELPLGSARAHLARNCAPTCIVNVRSPDVALRGTRGKHIGLRRDAGRWIASANCRPAIPDVQRTLNWLAPGQSYPVRILVDKSAPELVPHRRIRRRPRSVDGDVSARGPGGWTTIRTAVLPFLKQELAPLPRQGRARRTHGDRLGRRVMLNHHDFSVFRSARMAPYTRSSSRARVPGRRSRRSGPRSSRPFLRPRPSS